MYFWQFGIQFNKNRMTLTYSCQRKNEKIILKNCWFWS